MSEEKCCKRVHGDWGRSRQCSRNAVKDGFCKQHHPDAARARQIKSQELSDAKRKQSPYYKLRQANELIKELRAEILTIRNETLESCATLAETLKEDRHGKLPQFQVADAIREMKVMK